MIHFQEKNITVFQSALYQTSTAIIQSDEVMVLTDPNWLPSEITNIRTFIDKQLGSKKLYIIYTHSDFDHIIGSGAFPEAKVIASEELKQNPNKEKIMETIHQFDQRYYLERNYVPSYPEVDISIKNESENISLGDLTLTFYKAPGHTDDSLFTVIEPYGVFLSGDYLSDVEFPFISDSYHGYVNTMKKAAHIMEIFNINYLIPGHGSTTKEKQEMLNRIAFSTYYLQQLLHDTSDLESQCQAKYRFFDGMKDIHVDNKQKTAEEKA